MKSLTETYTLLTSTLQDLNQEIRLKLSSTHSCTVLEMLNLEQWQEEAAVLVANLENDLCLISQHLQLLKTRLQETQPKDSLKD